MTGSEGPWMDYICIIKCAIQNSNENALVALCYRLPYTFITREVAEATCACLMAQAEEAERTRQMDVIQERMIIEEFGRCLMQVIESATKTKGK